MSSSASSYDGHSTESDTTATTASTMSSSAYSSDSSVEKFAVVARAKKYHLEYEYVIEEFSKFFEYPNSQPKYPRVVSTNFYPSKDRRLQFYLAIYPRGKDEESKDHLSIYLYAVFTDPDISVLVDEQCFILKNSERHSLASKYIFLYIF